MYNTDKELLEDARRSARRWLDYSEHDFCPFILANARCSNLCPVLLKTPVCPLHTMPKERFKQLVERFLVSSQMAAEEPVIMPSVIIEEQSDEDESADEFWAVFKSGAFASNRMDFDSCSRNVIPITKKQNAFDVVKMPKFKIDTIETENRGQLWNDIDVYVYLDAMTIKSIYAPGNTINKITSSLSYPSGDLSCAVLSKNVVKNYKVTIYGSLI